jgi:hypothetical protein
VRAERPRNTLGERSPAESRRFLELARCHPHGRIVSEALQPRGSEVRFVLSFLNFDPSQPGRQLRRLIALLALVVVSAQPLLAMDCGAISPGPTAATDDPHASHRPPVSNESHHSGHQSDAPFGASSTCAVHSACSASVTSISPVLGEMPGLGDPTAVRLADELSSPDLSQDPPPPRPLH